MSDKWKASLPGIFTILFLVTFLLTQFIAAVPFDVLDWVKVALLGFAGLLGLAWVPPALDAQIGDQSFKGNIGPIMTLAVFGMHVADQFSAVVTPMWPQYLMGAFGLIAVWLGLPWTKPQLPSQMPMILLLFMAGVVLIIGTAGAFFLLA